MASPERLKPAMCCIVCGVPARALFERHRPALVSGERKLCEACCVPDSHAPGLRMKCVSIDGFCVVCACCWQWHRDLCEGFAIPRARREQVIDRFVSMSIDFRDDALTCALCRDRFAPNHFVVALPCAHVYCSRDECAHHVQRLAACAICREPIEHRYRVRPL